MCIRKTYWTTRLEIVKHSGLAHTVRVPDVASSSITPRPKYLLKLNFTRRNILKNRPREMDEFLTDPRIGRVASINQDGSPHIIPVVYLFYPEDGTFYFNTKTHTLTTKNLKRNPSVSMCVDDGNYPFRAVLSEGIAHISKEMGTDHEGQKLLVDHFYGPDMWATWVKSHRAQEIRVRITIEPKKWKWWDQRRKISGTTIL